MGGGADPNEAVRVDGGDCSVTVSIRCSNGGEFTVRAELGSTVAAFKAVVATSCEIPADQQRLIYKGRLLKDDLTLDSYGTRRPPLLTLVNSPNVMNSSVSHNSTQGSVRTTVSVDNGDFGGMDFGGMLFPGVSGNRASNLFGTELPELEHVQQQVAQNPNMMRETINMPVMQELMNDPDVMRNLIASNPLVCEIIDRNPDLGYVLNDPSTLRQTLEVARNPELRREMMRNSDRALRNIESSPEGFNMLRRMYETVQGPLINASTMTGDGVNDLGSNTFAALLGNPETGQARERSLSASTTGSETAMGSPGPNTAPLPNPWGGGAQTNSTATRSASVLDTRTPRTGRLGLPGLSRMLGGLPDPSVMSQMLQNPAVTRMMRNLLSNPQYMNQILNFNPQLRSLLESNSQLRETMQNPEFLRQLTSPETLQRARRWWSCWHS
ncbi:Ubiquitin domain-containing protein [Nymphaea thermarum]|nr:Ubiquitin domain-containing protein [Nymphaea thermarum]